MSVLLVLIPLLPLALIPFLGFDRTRDRAVRLAPLAMAPALLLAALAPPLWLTFDWFVLGAHLGLDGLGRPFLFLVALIWMLLTWYARAWLGDEADRGRLLGFMLAAGAGAMGVCVAQDIAVHYSLFTLMSLSAYGFILHRPVPSARRAGTIYVVLVVIAGLALFEALVTVAPDAGLVLAESPTAIAGSASRDLAIAMVLVAFGVHAGLPGLHGALPLACRAAPLPGAALLISAMMLGGLLGWLRFIPLGMVTAPAWGASLMALGAAATLAGAGYGLTQRSGKALLAYLGVAQSGLFLTGMGVGLTAPDTWDMLMPALLLHAGTSALALAALAMGMGLVIRLGRRPWIAVLLLPAALALAGAPFTGSGIARFHVGDALGGAANGTVHVAWALAFGAVLVSLLAGRLLLLVWREDGNVRRTDRPTAGLVLPCVLALLALAGIVLVWWIAGPDGARAALGAAIPRHAWQQGWPVLLGVLLAVAMGVRTDRLRIPRLPPGDAIVALANALRALRILLRSRVMHARLRRLAGVRLPAFETGSLPSVIEVRLRDWRVAGAAMLALLVVLALLLAIGRTG